MCKCVLKQQIHQNKVWNLLKVTDKGTLKMHENYLKFTLKTSQQQQQQESVKFVQS